MLIFLLKLSAEKVDSERDIDTGDTSDRTVNVKWQQQQHRQKEKKLIGGVVAIELVPVATVKKRKLLGVPQINTLNTMSWLIVGISGVTCGE